MPPSDGSSGAGPAVLLIGVGNELSGDDAAGLIAARRLREAAPEGIEVLESSGDGAALLDLLCGAKAVIIVDAVRSGATPGTIHRLDPSEKPLPRDLFPCSTHAFGVAEAVEIARALGELPRRCTILGIEGKRFDRGTGLSTEVEGALRDLVATLKRELASPAG